MDEREEVISYNTPGLFDFSDRYENFCSVSRTNIINTPQILSHGVTGDPHLLCNVTVRSAQIVECFHSLNVFHRFHPFDHPLAIMSGLTVIDLSGWIKNE